MSPCCIGIARLAMFMVFACGTGCLAVAGNPVKKSAQTGMAGTLPVQYSALVREDPYLIDYFSMNGSLAGARGRIALRGVHGETTFVAGPFGDSRSADLMSGGALCTTGDFPGQLQTVSFEMIFRIPSSKERKSAGGCLLGIRNGDEGRFSISCKTGSYYLSVWNGKGNTAYESDFCLKPDEWYHLAVAVSDKVIMLWLNGKPCRTGVLAGAGKAAATLPLVIGAGDAAGKTDNAGILVSHLAVYGGLLEGTSVAKRIRALGWPDPAELNDAQKLDSRIAGIAKEWNLPIWWKCRDDMIPPNMRGRMKATQASVEQARMVTGLCVKLLELWPKELTRHIKAVYVFDALEMGGVRGFCMEDDSRIYISTCMPEYVLWPRVVHESSHVVTRKQPLDVKLWNAQMAKGACYIGDEATKGDPFRTGDDLYKMGFLVQYSRQNLDEEFAVLSQYMFAGQKELRGLMDKYPEVRKRTWLAMNYYRRFNDKIDFSWCGDPDAGRERKAALDALRKDMTMHPASVGNNE